MSSPASDIDTDDRYARRFRIGLALALLGGIIVFGFNLTQGPGDFSLKEVIKILQTIFWSNTNPTDLNIDPARTAIIWDVRLPRAMIALLIGAAWGCAGAITQSFLQNPLAAPNVLGLSNGAAVAVIVGLTLGLDERALWVTPLLAAGGAIACFVMLFVVTAGYQSMTVLLLCGVALSTLFSAVISFLLSLNLADYQLTVKISAWLLGSLEGRSWFHLTWLLPFVGLSMLTALVTLPRRLDALQLGEETALSLGINLKRTYIHSILIVAILVGASVAVAGVIGFVGLIVPHIVRLLYGNEGRRLLPGAAVFGGIFLLLVDMLSRTILEVYLSPGAITSLIGAPVFLWLMRLYFRPGTAQGASR